MDACVVRGHLVSERVFEGERRVASVLDEDIRKSDREDDHVRGITHAKGQWAERYGDVCAGVCWWEGCV